MDKTEDAKVKSGTSSTTRSAENFLLDMAENAEIGGRVIRVMIKQSKNHLPKNQADL